MVKPVIRVPYESYPDDGFETLGESLTKQSFADECDFNKVLSKFEQTGLIPQVTAPPMYGDFSSMPDFHEANNLVIQVNTFFSNLPAKVREHFENDPSKYVDFVSDPKNLDVARTLGLLPDVVVGGASAPQDAGDATPSTT